MPTAPLSRRERNKADKRARIIAAASKGLALHGYDAMTMAWVAEEADVAVGTLFIYAHTKAELLMMVAAEQWRPQIEAWQATGTDDPRADIAHLLTPLVQAAVDDPQTTKAIARELLFGVPGEHRYELLRLVGGLEDALTERLGRTCAPRAARTGARLVISGCLVELNRARRQRDDEDSIMGQLREVITVAVLGAQASPDAEEQLSAASASNDRMQA